MVNMKRLNMRFGCFAIRYKGFVLFIQKMIHGFAVLVYQPAESEDDMEFEELRLENISEWEPGQHLFKTEGEAIQAGIEFINQR